MDIQPRDIITIIGGAVSLTGLYYALKRDVVKVSTALGKVESYHKREVTMLGDSIKETKEEFNTKLNVMKEEQNKAIDKLEKKIDVIAAQNLTISNNLAELAGFIRGTK
jgi:phage host-nuclease inhibitor protein Gam